MGKIVKFLIFNLFIFSLLICNFEIVSAIGYQTRAGYTYRDWLFSGPIRKWCIADSIAHGVHISWTSGLGTETNVKYNFYNSINWIWNWPDGINVFTQQGSFQSMDNYPLTGCIYIMGPMLARDIAPGAGLFEYSSVPPNVFSPIIAVTPDDVVHCLYFNAISMDSLLYSRNWSTPIRICPPAPEPMFPSHSLFASKITNKIVALWQCAEDPGQERAFYRLSNDGGINWQSPTQLPFPPSQEIGPSFNALYAMFDNQNNLHIVASVSDTTGYTAPAEIWHYCPTNSPQWSLIHHYAPETLAASCGYNAVFATRPSIVQNSRDNYLYVAWEQFDSLNYEPLTNLVRADIWIAESRDNGMTWSGWTKIIITAPNTTSKRFPCAGGVDHDTLSVAYLIDSIAGFAVYSQGQATWNPIVLHRIKVPLPITSIEENPIFQASSFMLQVSPNPFSSFSIIRYSLPVAGKVSLQLYNTSGRLIKTLVDEYKRSGNYSITLNSKTLSAGIYFYTLKTAHKTITQKLIKTKQ